MKLKKGKPIHIRKGYQEKMDSVLLEKESYSQFIHEAIDFLVTQRRLNPYI